MQAINTSIEVDRRLFREDIAGSLAHVAMLAAQGILTADQGKRITSGLRTIEREIEAGKLVCDPTLEDIHMHIEARLAELIGEDAGRLHTARSRNDQVATDFRLFVRQTAMESERALARYQLALARKAKLHAETIMPGFTHQQTAQPITLGHHLLAYVEMASRDRARFADMRSRANECPLGAAALAGTAFPIDRHAVAAHLGFDRPAANSLDAVASRDFCLEFLACAQITALHFSRLAEEFVLWSSDAFRFITLDDTLSTGSSIMPQKRNPDAAELVRAKAGRILGAFTALASVMKGLPLAYAKDLQEDKPAVFDAADTLLLCAQAMTALVDALAPDTIRMREMAARGHATATDLADWLVRELALPFRAAHHTTGRIVALADSQGKRLESMDLDALRSIEPRITAAVFDILAVEKSVASRDSYGGTAPSRVAIAADNWIAALAGQGQENGVRTGAPA